MPPQFWQRALEKAAWMTRLYGLTLPPLTAAHGAAAYIASLAEYHASLSAPLEHTAAPPTIDGSGTTYIESFGRLNPDKSHWKTYPDLFGMDYPLSPEIWPPSGIASDGALYRQPAWEPRTEGIGYSYWPTATVSGNNNGRHRSPKAGDGLAVAAKEWPTPVQEWQTPTVDSFRSRSGNRKHEQGLDQQARLWPMPAATDHKGSTHLGQRRGQLSEAILTWPTPRAAQDAGRHHGAPDSLDHAARNQTQDSPPAQPTPPHGSESSPPAPNSRRRLNPDFVDWMMNTDPGWTDCAHRVTESL